MSGYQDHYAILGVRETASAKEITQAYRRLAMKWHPDRNRDNIANAEHEFKRLGEAYRVLGDPHLRALHDATRVTARPHTNEFDGQQPFKPNAGPFDTYRPSGERGKDLKAKVSVPLETLVSGGEVEVKIDGFATCSACAGHGRFDGYVGCGRCGGAGVTDAGYLCRKCGGAGVLFRPTCDVCRGKGLTRQKQTLSIKVRAGTPSNATLRVRSAGEPAPRGGPRGDLLLSFSVKPHKLYKLTGLTLTADIKVDFVTALLGGTAGCKIFDRKVKATIPAGARAGRLITVPGEGLKHPRTGETGDLKLRVVLDLPEGARKLTREHRQILKSMFEAAAARR
ncbi:J domain-containing protein [Paraburkholderia azotifigens]|uniref:J domain-containing protein n=1 Tax=Paraburkholderia azotifigens TaxID=2057004 RepID=UPI0031810D43